jgi:prepilin-type N-terminal cleavage/methylation domain-containing protein
MKENNGFTIIEITVVIAIIGILASMTLRYDNLYVKRAKDSAIKENLESLFSESFVYLSSHGNYGAFCNNFVVTRVLNQLNPENEYCHHSDTEWVVCSRLYEDKTKAWCVDSTGFKGEIDDEKCEKGISVCP